MGVPMMGTQKKKDHRKSKPTAPTTRVHPFFEDGYRGPGWKQRGSSFYEGLMRTKTVYEFEGQEGDDTAEYRLERQRIVEAIPRKPQGSILDGSIVLYAHFFGGWDWYAAAYDPDEDIAFGFVVGFAEEWGDFCLREVETVRGRHQSVIYNGTPFTIAGALTECDICWTPITFAELQARRGVA